MLRVLTHPFLVYIGLVSHAALSLTHHDDSPQSNGPLCNLHVHFRIVLRTGSLCTCAFTALRLWSFRQNSSMRSKKRLYHDNSRGHIRFFFSVVSYDVCSLSLGV